MFDVKCGKLHILIFLKMVKGHAIQDKKGLSRVDCWEAGSSLPSFPQISKAFARKFKIEVRIFLITYVFIQNKQRK